MSQHSAPAREKLAAPAMEHGSGEFSSLAQHLAPYATVIRTRKRQRFTIEPGRDRLIYFVSKGLFLVGGTLPNNQIQALVILAPGDVAMPNSLPPLHDMTISALSEDGEIWRLRWPLQGDARTVLPLIMDDLQNHIERQSAKLALHTAVIGHLTGPERVATLLIELALRTGSKSGSGVTFEMPLSRVDVADYLALNADTVSRVVARMRATKLISRSGRNRIVCRDITALMGESPLATILATMYPGEHDTHLSSLSRAPPPTAAG